MRELTLVLIVTAACGGRGPGTSDAFGALATCGNAVVEDGEDCDLGAFNIDTGVCKQDCTDQRCGDGFKGLTEVCDDGNADDDDSCTRACVPPVLCPNGRLDPGESCDDGNDEEDDACLPGCVDALCGDGVIRTDIVEPADPLFEACDDGVHNSDFAANACRSNCQPASCGDGVVDDDEGCDEGAGNSDTQADACRTDCELPSCGDGTVDTVEACDDGTANSDTEADACRTDCRAASCGDHATDSNEACDTAGDTSTCDDDCTVPSCGDGHTNGADDEDCDDSGESETCDPDCSHRTCGDGYVNVTAGEECEVSTSVLNGACSIACHTVCSGFWANCTLAPGCESDLQTSSDHCGECGHDCGGGACVAGKCQPLKIAELPHVHLTSFLTLRLHEGMLYAATNSTDGLAAVSAASKSLVPPTMYPNVKPYFRALTAHEAALYFYASSGSGGAGIYAAPIDDPTAAPALIAGTDACIAMESDGQHIYFMTMAPDGSGEDAPSLQRMSISDLAVEVVGFVPDSPSILPGFDLIVEGADVYFVQSDVAEVWRMAKDPDDPFPVFVSGGTQTLDLATDSDWVYWSDDHKIRRVAKDPFGCLPNPICAAEDFVSATVGAPRGVAADGAYVYWVEQGPGALMRRRTTGGAVEQLASGLTAPTTVVVAEDFAYWLDAPQSPSNAPGSIWKVRK